MHAYCHQSGHFRHLRHVAYAYTLDIASLCNKGITQFYSFTCRPCTNELYLPLLPRRKASAPFGWYSLRLPTKWWPGWVDLGGWLHTEVNVPHLELNLDTVTHPSTNRARRRLISLIETNALPLRRTTMHLHFSVHISSSVQFSSVIFRVA